ncbi:PREDICTED: uncharacterized protein LOC104609520 isoform X2 [Nelumbo nucifera]|uniref:Uncharacterized protein LOC104609520 isoform X2 n=1 Tax=Nelumbo nucifera TaxID=4432 RepID=A0A1U8B472_NELNU|nr:PREDICTED: uncharacterized protein LOC104609520 isoform X2 [Nelumbo nucifera]
MDRLLMGKLGVDLEHCIDGEQLLKELKNASLNTEHCSCCRVADYASLRYSVGHGNLPDWDILRKRREKSSGAVMTSHLGSCGFDPSSHVEYSKLKITSDSESEFPFSDDDERNALVCKTEDLKQDFVTQRAQLDTPIMFSAMVPKTSSNDFIPEKLIHRGSSPEPSLLVPPMQCEENYMAHEINNLKEEIVALSSRLEFLFNCIEMIPESAPVDLTPEKLSHQASTPEPFLLVPCMQLDEYSNVTSLASTIAFGHCMELNWHQGKQKANPSATPELTSINDISASSNSAEAPICVPRKNLDATGTSHVGTTITENMGACKPKSMLTIATTSDLKEDQVLNDLGSTTPSQMDLNDAYKLAINNRGSHATGMLSEQLDSKYSSREDLKVPLSQVSNARGLELALNDVSPRAYGFGDELKISDASVVPQLLPKKSLTEKNECGTDSWDESTASETEVESIVDRLKRQSECYRKCMAALYKELEEERNASAVAANHSLAMITRLQEEKASLHMEALQYLRMMEEQSEYDMEALQKANDLLAEREKDIQDLEAELEYYKEKYPNDSMLEEIQEEMCDLKGRDMKLEHSHPSSIQNSTSISCNSTFTEKCEGDNKTEGTDVVCRDNSIGIAKEIEEPMRDLKRRDMELEHSDPSSIQKSTGISCNSTLNKKCEGGNSTGGTDLVCGDNSIGIAKDSPLDFEDEKLYISQCLKKLEKKLYLFSNNGVHVDMSNGGYSGKETHIREKLHCEQVSQGNIQLEDNSSIQKDQSLFRESPPAQERSSPSIRDSVLGSKGDHNFGSVEEDSSIASRETNLVVLRNEVSNLNNRLEAVEADHNFLKYTISSLQNGDEGLQFIQEIAHHLRELRRIVTK